MSTLPVLDYSQLASLLPPRPADAHKGLFGHVLVVGGDTGFGGAVLMAGEAALRTGAGLVSVATQPAHVPALLSRRPELMAHAITDPRQLSPLLERASVIVLGPGLGQGEWGNCCFSQVMNSKAAREKPLLVDADGLNLLATQYPNGPEQPFPKSVLTPHPGEAARLLHQKTADIQGNREGAVCLLQALMGGSALLKGKGTLVATPVSGDVTVERCDAGNPGMASGGMGDVLSGVIGGLLAQGLSPADATRLGVCLHARAGDLAAAADGQRGLLATDLMPYLRQLANPA